MTKEIWANIPYYEGYYQASDLGRIRSVGRFINSRYLKGRVLRPSINSDGYKMVVLSKEGKQKSFEVQRLVWVAFNGDIPEGMYVNHINEDKIDNRLENLNLMTPKENANWGTRNRRISNKLTNGCTSKDVFQYTEDGWFVKKWKSAYEIQRVLGYSQGNINACCIGKRRTAYGFVWSYE